MRGENVKTSTGRKVAIATLLTLLLASSALTVGRAMVPPPTTPRSSTCKTLDDATLANNVRDHLAKTMSPAVMDRIQITAKNRVVTLIGSVNFKGTRSRLVTLARKVACVRRVINKIQFKQSAEECTGGTQNCCCPEEGCVCSRICPPCGPSGHPPSRKP